LSPSYQCWWGGNLCTKNIEPFVKKCPTQANPDKIIILTDLECDPCVTATKARIVHEGIDKIIVVKKALEAWFIADTLAMRTWLGSKDFFETAPELTPDMPWQRLKQITFESGARGPGERKIAFTQRMINRFGFSIERAANHPNCPSAKYFLEKLQNL